MSSTCTSWRIGNVTKTTSGTRTSFHTFVRTSIIFGIIYLMPHTINAFYTQFYQPVFLIPYPWIGNNNNKILLLWVYVCRRSTDVNSALVFWSFVNHTHCMSLTDVLKPLTAALRRPRGDFDVTVQRRHMVPALDIPLHRRRCSLSARFHRCWSSPAERWHWPSRRYVTAGATNADTDELWTVVFSSCISTAVLRRRVVRRRTPMARLLGHCQQADYAVDRRMRSSSRRCRWLVPLRPHRTFSPNIELRRMAPVVDDASLPRTFLTCSS